MLSRLFRLNGRNDHHATCDFSIIVVAYNMARELPRTLRSLSRDYQRDTEAIDYEVIVVDNGSEPPVDAAEIAGFGPEFSLRRVKNPLPSPCSAINDAVATARGRRIGIIIDGARMVTPGVLAWAHRAASLYPNGVACALGFHLGPEHQSNSSRAGYDRNAEDCLLERIRWPENGYRLFEIAALAGSSRYCWAGPIAESNCMFLDKALFERLGGFDERFRSPGGGLVNLDFFKRACEAPGVDLVYLVGEGCFHQIHGGVTTGGGADSVQRYDDLQAEYREIRGEDFKAPPNTPILLGFSIPQSARLQQQGAAALSANNRLQSGFEAHMAAAKLGTGTAND